MGARPHLAGRPSPLSSARMHARTATMAPLRILILSDGRPGHYNLSEGIAAAVGRLGPSSIVRCEVRRGRWPGAVLAALTQMPAAPERCLRLVYGLDADALPQADLIVSAGAETLAASVWLARRRAIPNVHYGSLRRFRPTDFALVLTSYARKANLPRHLLALKPSAFDPDQLHCATAQGSPGSQPPRRPPRASRASRSPPRHVALLIGGDAGTFTYTTDDWDRLLAFVQASHDASGIVWRISNSRRTPAEVSDRLAGIAAAASCGVALFIDVRSPGAATLMGLLGEVDAVVCTDDSSSMISECIWARLPVIGVTPAAFHHTPEEAEYRAWLESSGWSGRLAISDLTPASLLEALAALTPLDQNPLDELAGRLATALPALALKPP